jgi:1-acyl-sn-glycerol-3-phosphate acyltransferase
MAKLAQFILGLFGWKAVFQAERPLGNCVMIVAPHTSYWDFVIGRLSLFVGKFNGKFLIKKEYFHFPFRHLLKWFGCMPVDRERGSNAVKHVVDIFKNSNDLSLIITPEGTRSYTAHWKKGYYFIASAAKIPIVLAYVDYKEKVCCVSNVKIYPSGNYEEDLKKIEQFYRGKVAKFPKDFNLS